MAARQQSDTAGQPAAPRPARRFGLNRLPWPELISVLAFVAIVYLIAHVIGVPVTYPRVGSMAFLGIHYLIPLGAVVAWGFVLLRAGQGAGHLGYAVVAFGCYAVTLIMHFNVKMWIQLINPTSFDAFYMWTDELMRPLVDGAIWLAALMDSVVPGIDAVYLYGFILMFYLSLVGHTMRRDGGFQHVFLAVLVFQILGSLSYLVAPAIGPFIYEPGIGTAPILLQARMLEAYRALHAGGPAWVAAEGAQYFAGGLAAMPSLHAGAAWLFLVFARRYLGRLYYLYVAIFAFIVLEAVATRWHYIIDLPFGMALAWLCIWISDRVRGPSSPWAGRAG